MTPTPNPVTDLPAYDSFRAVQRVRGSAEALELAASIRRHPAGKGVKK